MALIGEMHYLTIGGNTYSIPVSGGSTVTIERALTSGTKSATISVDGTSYDLYAPTPNAGTVTSVRVQATSPVQSSTSTAQSSTLNTTISLANGYGDTKNPYGTKTANYVLAGPSSGTAAAPSFRKLVAADIPDLSETYLTSYTETDPTVPSWAKASTKPSYTASEVGAATSTHTHGNITNGGDITATAPTIANGDQIIINDNSASKITNGPTFDGSTTTTALTPKGTWESFSKFSGSYNDLSNKPTIPTVPTAVSAFTNDAGYITSADVPEGASAYTGTISAVGTTASNGTNNGFARGDHVHNITKTTIDTQLGTGSGTTKFYREDGTWATPAYTTNTDTKLQIAAVTSGTTYYPIVAANSTTAATRQYDSTGIAYTGTNGTANGTNGNALLTLGNSTASTTANWKKGTVRLYGTTAYYTDLVSGGPTGNRTITFPDATGTVALTSDLSSFITDAGVTKITTTAGTHSVITNATGAVSFNVPTKTSHLTNDSGFITTDSDEKLKTVALTSGTTYYPILATGANAAANRQVDSTLGGLKYISSAGTTSAVGTATLYLGNATASGTANNEQGVIRLYGTTAYYTDIKAESGLPAANRTIYIPSYAGTMYLTCTSTTNAVGGATTAPVYVKDTGEIAAVTSIPYSLLTGTPTIPTIPSNNITGSGTSGKVAKFTGTYTIGDGWGVTDNSSNTDVTSSDTNLITGRTLYYQLAKKGYTTNAGTITGITTSSPLSGSGTSGSVALSHATSGVGNAVTTVGFYKFKYDTYGHVTGVSSVAASDITGLVTIPSITLNGSSTTSPSFYAPTSAGTSGYYLKSNGSGAPTWAAVSATDTKVTQAYSTASSSYPLLMTATADTSSTASRGDTTAILNNGLYYTPSSQKLTVGMSVKINNWTWDGETTTGHMSLVYN